MSVEAMASRLTTWSAALLRSMPPYIQLQVAPPTPPQAGRPGAHSLPHSRMGVVVWLWWCSW